MIFVSNNRRILINCISAFFFYKMKTKKYQIVGTVQKIDRQFVETDATSTHIAHLLMTTHITHLLMTTHNTLIHDDTHYTLIHDRSLSWLCAGPSGVVKLVLGPEPTLLVLYFCCVTYIKTICFPCLLFIPVFVYERQILSLHGSSTQQ